jgi:hypothetical protein
MSDVIFFILFFYFTMFSPLPRLSLQAMWSKRARSALAEQAGEQAVVGLGAQVSDGNVCAPRA